MTRLVPFLVLLSSMTFAGCIADDAAPAPDPAMEAPEATEPTVPRPDAPAPETELPEPTTMAVEGSGTTSQGAWFCTDPHGTGGCPGQEVEGDEYTVHVAFEGTLLAADLEITWEALDPTFETMVIVHGIHTENGTERFAPFESTSPATIDLQDLEKGPGGLVYIALWPAAEAKGPAGAAFVDVQRQEFEIVGTLGLIAG